MAFDYTSGNPDNLVGGSPARMQDIQGPFYDLRAYLNTLLPSIPTGSVLATACPAAPAGYLMCDGSAVSRSGANAALFAAIGTTYGAGDGSTTFNLPDLRGRVPVGADPGAFRLTNGAFRTLGQGGGEEKHVITAAEMASHQHGYSGLTVSGASAYGAGGSFALNNSTGTAPNTLSAGSDAAHNNMQPGQIVNYIIKL